MTKLTLCFHFVRAGDIWHASAFNANSKEKGNDVRQVLPKKSKKENGNDFRLVV